MYVCTKEGGQEGTQEGSQERRQAGRQEGRQADRKEGRQAGRKEGRTWARAQTWSVDENCIRLETKNYGTSQEVANTLSLTFSVFITITFTPPVNGNAKQSGEGGGVD